MEGPKEARHSGKISGQELPALLQLVQSLQLTGELRLTSTSRDVRLWHSKGEIHSITGEIGTMWLEDAPALAQAMSGGEYDYRFTIRDVTAPRTYNSSLSNLLMSAAQMVDEVLANHGGPSAAELEAQRENERLIAGILRSLKNREAQEGDPEHNEHSTEEILIS